MIAIGAAVSGQLAWTDIEDDGHIHGDWFQTFWRLPNGLPSHETFRYLFTRLEPEAFQRCFADGIAALSQDTPWRHIAIDGQSLCGSADRTHGQATLHLVSVWASHNHLTRAQVATEEKSNAITALPRLLQILDLKGCIVTSDALGCQKEIAAQVIADGGDYGLAVKDNQPTLHQDIEAAFAMALGKGFAGLQYDLFRTEEEPARVTCTSPPGRSLRRN